MTINFIRLDTKTAGRVLVLLAYLLFVCGLYFAIEYSASCRFVEYE